MGYGHTAWFGAIECAIRWGNGTPRGWRELSNVQWIMAHRVVWWRLVGAVPVCPPVSPHKGASIVQFPAHNACVFGMETPLRERSGGHTGTAPTISFGWIAHGRLVSLGQIVRGTIDVVWWIARGCSPPMHFVWIGRLCFTC